MPPTLTSVARAQAYVAKMPGAVEGHHGDGQTLAVANVLVWDFALPASEALALLREFNARCSPPWTDAELARKLQSAEQQPHAKPRGNLIRDHAPSEWWLTARALRPERKGQIDPATAVENYLAGFRCDAVDLWDASPIRAPEDWHQDGITLLESLYRPGEQINFVSAYKLMTKKDGTTKANPDGYGTTAERDALIARWRQHDTPAREAGGWLRMNPVDGKGVTDDHVTAHRFALIECDAIPLALQLPLLAKLPLPMAAILTSGGRSLHAWVQVDCATANDYRQTVTKMLALLGKFGVDNGNKNPSRLSRLPGVVRRIGATGDGRQRLLYLNPKPVQKAIL